MVQTHSDRVWEGDPQAVIEAREAYAKDPSDENLINLAVALYSARATRRLGNELIELRYLLFEYAERFMVTMNAIPDTNAGRADRADVVSTHFEWMSRSKGLNEVERHELREAAIEMFEYGIRYAAIMRTHTWCLLQLTAARLNLNEKNRQAALVFLEEVAKKAENINDLRQRVRVYAKLGLLYRKCFRYIAGYGWGIRAIFVPRVPQNVRLKAGAALVGIDR